MPYPRTDDEPRITCSQRELSRAFKEQTTHIKVRDVPFTFTKGKGEPTTLNIDLRVDYPAMNAWDSLLQSRGFTGEHIRQRLIRIDPAALPALPGGHVQVELIAADEPSRAALQDQVFSCPCYNDASFEIRTCRAALNDQINLPLMGTLFDEPTRDAIRAVFYEPAIRRPIEWGFAVMHEACHAVGPVAVTPHRREDLLLDGFSLDVAGEIVTDSLGCAVLDDVVPELTWYTIVQRAPGHWPRRGCRTDPVASALNTDNDALAAAAMFGKLRVARALAPASTGRLHADRAACAAALGELAREVGEAVASGDSAREQEANLHTVLRRYVPRDNNRYTLHPDLIAVFAEAQHLPLGPSLSPLPW